jgi:peptidylprolyl isomerase
VKRAAVLLLIPALALGACGAKAAPERPGVTVTGTFGQKPTLTIPATAPPTRLATRVLHAGTGPALVKGQTMVADYLGETWDRKDGQPEVFDNSYDDKLPVGFPIGTGAVLPGWDQALVGQRVGSRVLLTVPPALAYGTGASASADPDNDLAGHTLVFVVDVVGAVDPLAASSGAPAGPLPAGLPAVSSQPGRQPAITSVSGVRQVTSPRSGLLVRGDGPKIDPSRALALQIVETDLATGKETESTWGRGVDVIPGSEVMTMASVLQGQNIGSRAVAVTPPQSGTAGGVVLVMDVVAQF